MALILVPAIAAVGFMVMGNSGASASATLATLLYTLLTAGVFVGLFKMARRWENERDA